MLKKLLTSVGTLAIAAMVSGISIAAPPNAYITVSKAKFIDDGQGFCPGGAQLMGDIAPAPNLAIDKAGAISAGRHWTEAYGAAAPFKVGWNASSPLMKISLPLATAAVF